MPRPRHEHPTPAELEVLKILWDQGPSTGRQIMDVLNHEHPRAYTSVMSLLGVMTDKGLLKRRPKGRGFVYECRVNQEKTVGQMLRDLLSRAFQGSAACLVESLLDHSNPSPEELAEIHKAIAQYRRKQEDK